MNIDEIRADHTAAIKAAQDFVAANPGAAAVLRAAVDDAIAAGPVRCISRATSDEIARLNDLMDQTMARIGAAAAVRKLAAPVRKPAVGTAIAVAIGAGIGISALGLWALQRAPYRSAL